MCSQYDKVEPAQGSAPQPTKQGQARHGPDLPHGKTWKSVLLAKLHLLAAARTSGVITPTRVPLPVAKPRVSHISTARCGRSAVRRSMQAPATTEPATISLHVAGTSSGLGAVKHAGGSASTLIAGQMSSAWRLRRAATLGGCMKARDRRRTQAAPGTTHHLRPRRVSTRHATATRPTKLAVVERNTSRYREAGRSGLLSLQASLQGRVSS